MQKYIIECRDENGQLDFTAEAEARKAHPYLFSKQSFSIDHLVRYASYGQGRDNPSGPLQLPKFFKGIGLTYRAKTW